MAELMDDDRLTTELADMSGWEGDRTGIRKAYEHDDFAGAMTFVNRVAQIAESRNHHPDIGISWSTVELKISSHAAGGVTVDCLELARAIDA